MIGGGRTARTSRCAPTGLTSWSASTPSRTDAEVDRLRQAIRTTAHEIRNPVSLLNGIAGVVAEAGNTLTDQQKAHLLAAVGRQAAVLERVTDDLLTAAQAGRGTLRVDVRAIALAPLLREVVQDVAGAQPVHVSVPEDVTVLADRTPRQPDGGQPAHQRLQVRRRALRRRGRPGALAASARW